MSDTNTQQPETRQKTYLERFQELESSVSKLGFVSNFQVNALQEILQQINQMADNFSMVRDTVNSMIKLMETDQKVTMENIATKMVELQNESQKKRIKADLDNGNLLVMESVKDDSSILEFSVDPDIAYGVSPVSAMPEEAKKELLGKKVGDTVAGVKVLGIYEINPEKLTQQPENSSNENQTKQ